MSTKATKLSRMAAQAIASSKALARGSRQTSGAASRARSAARRSETTARRSEDAVRRSEDAAIARVARYLVTYDSAIIATFAREDDAFLLESELADLDAALGKDHVRCEVFDRSNGRRLGGYLISGGKMVLFVRDEGYEARFERRRR